MKKNPTAFVLVVVVARLTGVYLVLELIYSGATAFLTMPSGMAAGILNIWLRGAVLPVLAALILWFGARPLAALVVNDLDSGSDTGRR